MTMSIREMDMLLYLADESSKAAKEAAKRSPASQRLLRAADVENADWASFKAKLQLQREKLKSQGGDDGVDELDEDDMGTLLVLIDALDATRKVTGNGRSGTPLTLSEIVLLLQRDRVLSLEFTAAARAQTQRLLTQLRALNKVWQDPAGRWALL